MTYKIVETFDSIQGEGLWAGTPMSFIRFSQCPVGGPKGLCSSWDGITFACDTGPTPPSRRPGIEWHSYTEVNDTWDDEQLYRHIISRVGRHICFTGGEPLIYNFDHLFAHLAPRPHIIHIETSGTANYPDWADICDSQEVHITLSPKLNAKSVWYKRADELKFLVHKNTGARELLELIFVMGWAQRKDRIFLQPLENSTYKENLTHAIHLCELCDVRLSLQLHKYLDVR